MLELTNQSDTWIYYIHSLIFKIQEKSCTVWYENETEVWSWFLWGKVVEISNKEYWTAVVYISKALVFIRLFKNISKEALISENAILISVRNSWLSILCFSIYSDQKFRTVWTTKHLCSHRVQWQKRGILPIPFMLEQLKVKGKAEGTNLCEIILLKRKTN